MTQNHEQASWFFLFSVLPKFRNLLEILNYGNSQTVQPQ